MPELSELDAAVPETQEWISDLMKRLGWQDRGRVFAALIATLHALRDCLPYDEAVYVGAYFPPLLRGLYYDGWHPGHRRGAMRTRKAFLERIHESLHRDPGIDPENVAHAVFALVAARLPASELEEARAATPGALHGLWPS